MQYKSQMFFFKEFVFFFFAFLKKNKDFLNFFFAFFEKNKEFLN
jgi:hypothetical protein